MDKLSRYVMGFSVFLTLAVIPLPIFAESNASWIKIDRYQIDPSHFYIIEHDGWEFPSCPDARHARLDNNHTKYDEIVSTIMLAYSTRIGIIIHGSCSTSDIVNMTHLFLQDDLSE